VCETERGRERVCLCDRERGGEREYVCVCVCVCACTGVLSVFLLPERVITIATP